MRRLEVESLIVIFNAGQTGYPVRFSAGRYLPKNSTWCSLINGGQTSLRDGLLTGFSIPLRSGEVLAVAT